jgi:excisionase family DNA binding protein
MSESVATAGQDKKLLTVAEAARRLGIDKKLLHKAVADGSVRSVKLAGLSRIPVAELARLLAPKEA